MPLGQCLAGSCGGSWASNVIVGAEFLDLELVGHKKAQGKPHPDFALTKGDADEPFSRTQFSSQRPSAGFRPVSLLDSGQVMQMTHIQGSVVGGVEERCTAL